MPTYHHGNLRAALIQAAIELVEEKGDVGLTLRAVGRRLGVSHAAPYHHFKNKEDLLRAVAVEGFRMLHDRLGGRDRDARETSLRRFSLEYVRFAVTHETLFRIMHRPMSAELGQDPLRARAFQAHRELWARMAGSPHRGLVAWTAMYGIAGLWIDGALKSQAGGQTVAVFVTTAIDSLR